MHFYFQSLTGQTRRFLKKAGYEADATELTETNFLDEVDAPFIVIVPSYDLELNELIFDFLTADDNFKHCVGVVGTGNRNFGTDFAWVAQLVAHDFSLPLLFTCEFSGTPADYLKFREVVDQLEHS